MGVSEPLTAEEKALAEALHDEYDDLLCRVFEDIDVPPHHDMPPEWWEQSARRRRNPRESAMPAFHSVWQ